VGVFEANLGSVFRLYRAGFARCWLPSLLLALAWGWIATLLDRRLGSSDDLLLWLAQVQALAWSGYFWRLVLAASAVSAFLYSAMVADLYATATGGATPLAAGFVAALRSFPGVVVAGAIFLVVTSAASAFFILPGAYLWGMWQLWLVVLVVERSGPIEALRRSWQLMLGAWWRISVLITLVTVISALPVLLFDTMTSTILMLLGREAMHAPPLVSALAVALDMFLLPLIPAGLVTAYLDRQRAPVVLG
jgi:hypothetical protein